MKEKACEHPTALGGAGVCSVGKRLSATTSIITDIRPSKLPLALLQDNRAQPLPLHRKLPMTREDGRVATTRKNPIVRRGRGEPVGDPCLEATLKKETYSAKVKPMHHTHRHLAWNDTEVSTVKRHFHLRTTEHYCPVNESKAGDPVPDTSFDKSRSKSAPAPLFGKLPVTPADSGNPK